METMTFKEYERRINESIKETNNLLIKARTNYENALKCLIMDIEENKELGNDKTANKPWVDRCNECKRRIKGLQAHLDKLTDSLTNPEEIIKWVTV